MNRKQIWMSFAMNVICIALLMARIPSGNLRLVVVDLIVVSYLTFRCFQLTKEVQSSSRRTIK